MQETNHEVDFDHGEEFHSTPNLVLQVPTRQRSYSKNFNLNSNRNQKVDDSFQKLIINKKQREREILENIRIMQEQMIQKTKKNDKLFQQGLQVLYQNVKDMKKRCNLIKVAGGYTTEEYLRY